VFDEAVEWTGQRHQVFPLGSIDFSDAEFWLLGMMDLLPE